MKLSREFVEAARLEAEASHRSLAAQVEHWASLGRAVERALGHSDVLALKGGGGELSRAFPEESKQRAILQLLETVASSSDRSPVLERVGRGARTVYATDPEFPGMIVRIDPDGTRTPGRFENRRFVPALHG
ncbi:MAG: hypothetical protein HY900_03745 [Deltaproteobacteria bacterium]|nr:hypothetical protein [Deltaproteobacteria bacterium]